MSYAVTIVAARSALTVIWWTGDVNSVSSDTIRVQKGGLTAIASLCIRQTATETKLQLILRDSASTKSVNYGTGTIPTCCRRAWLGVKLIKHLRHRHQ